jgi:hypothetical protein
MSIVRRLRVLRRRTARWFQPPIGVVLGGAENEGTIVPLRGCAPEHPKAARGQRSLQRVH